MTTYKNILCATDFSPRCKVAAERAVEFARLLGSKLTFLHVVDHFPEDRSNQVIAPENEDPAAYREATARESLAELASALGYRDAAQEVLLTTRAAKYEILSFAADQQVDLIVVASRSYDGVLGLLGSTASGLVNRASCDVLVVHAEKDLEVADC